MMLCWNCGRRLAREMAERDGLIRGREEQRGGPYLLYICPGCSRESRIERTRGGRWFASPEKEVALADFLFSWSELLTPEDFLKLAAWHAQFAERRKLFFLREGDRRYARRGVFAIASAVAAWLRRRFARERAVEPAPRVSRGAEAPAGEALAALDFERVPHPYAILGLAPGASQEEVRRSFRSLVLSTHPDKLGPASDTTGGSAGGTAGGSAEEVARRRFQELVRAYELLREREERQKGQ